MVLEFFFGGSTARFPSSSPNAASYCPCEATWFVANVYCLALSPSFPADMLQHRSVVIAFLKPCNCFQRSQQNARRVLHQHRHRRNDSAIAGRSQPSLPANQVHREPEERSNPSLARLVVRAAGESSCDYGLPHRSTGILQTVLLLLVWFTESDECCHNPRYTRSRLTVLLLSVVWVAWNTHISYVRCHWSTCVACTVVAKQGRTQP